MIRLLKDIGNHPKEYFDIYVYLVGLYVVGVLAKDGRIMPAILQGIIWFGYIYGRHRDSLK